MATPQKRAFLDPSRNMWLMLVVVWVVCFLLSGVLKDDNSFNLLGVLSFLVWWVGTVLLGLYLVVTFVRWLMSRRTRTA